MEDLDNENEFDEGDDGADSIASRASRAPSMHPSVAYSMACSESTIGAGDETGYWDYQHRVVEKKDLGHRCRECRMPFRSLGDPLTERRGARTSCKPTNLLQPCRKLSHGSLFLPISLSPSLPLSLPPSLPPSSPPSLYRFIDRYHAECFSGFADPRSQCQSSHHVGKLRGTQYEAAPGAKAGSKMRTTSHFTAGSRMRGSGAGFASRKGARQNDKIAAFMGGNSFRGTSSKGTGVATAASQESGEAGLTVEALREHDARMDVTKKT